MKKGLSLFVLMFFLMGLPICISAADTLTVDTIKENIRKRGTRWSAGETAASRLPEKARRALFGLKKKAIKDYLPGSTRLAKKIGEKRAVIFPVTFDWRDQGGMDFTTPIRDQGGCGSCWAFGSLAAVESLMEIGGWEFLLNPDLSEQFMVSCSGGSCGGWYLDDTAEFLKNTGSTDELCFLYVAQDRPCSERCPDWESRIERISGWSWVGGTPGLATVDEIKQELEKGPLFGSMAIYSDFLYYTGGVYEHVSGGLEGYHAIAIVGWDDTNQCWICKNSWGTDWGESGWFRIKMGTNESLIEEETIWFDVEGQGPCSEDDSGELDIVGIAGAPGGTVTVPIRIQSAPNGVFSVGFEVTFNSTILNYTGHSRGGLVSDFDFFDCNVPGDKPDVVRCGGFKSTGGIAQGASGDVVYLSFDVIDCEKGLNYTLDLQELKDDIVSWSTSLGCFQCGCDCDVNGDGDVTPQDALCAFQKYLGIDPTACGPIEDICCDVNLDDDCTPADALEIFREYLGMESVCSSEGVE